MTRPLEQAHEAGLEQLRLLASKAAEGPWFVERGATPDGLSKIEDGRQHGMFPVTGEAHEIAFLHAAGEYVRGLLVAPAPESRADGLAVVAWRYRGQDDGNCWYVTAYQPRADHLLSIGQVVDPLVTLSSAQSAIAVERVEAEELRANNKRLARLFGLLVGRCGNNPSVQMGPMSAE